MTLHPAWTRSSRLALRLGLALGLTFGLALSADARARKHHHHSGGQVGSRVWSQPYGGQRAANQNASGPLYFAQEYLGTDPDPNIRFQLMRDISGRYGGGGD